LPHLVSRRRYISASIQLDLFETANIKLEVPYRLNQKNWKLVFIPFAKARKRIETLFSQLCDQFMIERNYAKQTTGLLTRILSKNRTIRVLLLCMVLEPPPPLPVSTQEVLNMVLFSILFFCIVVF